MTGGASGAEQGTVLITGGTGGLGRETARQVAGPGTTVVVTGRDQDTAMRHARDLSAATGAGVHGMALDLGALRDVRRFAAEVVALDLPPLRAVVCNAGVQTVTGTKWTADGFEYTFAVNHLAHLLLVTALLDHLREPARVVLVSSGTAHDGRRRYTTSKLCNVLTTYELARRLADEHPGITVNAYDPGLMPGTGLARDYGRVQGFVWRRVLPALTIVPGLDVRTPRQAATGLARLITDPELRHTSGRYVSGTTERPSSARSYDRELQADLWRTSMELLRDSA